MAAKAVCTAVIGCTYYLLAVPPKAGKQLSKTEDKMGKDAALASVHVFHTHKIAPVITFLFTGAYLYLLAQGRIPSGLEWWQIIALPLHLAAYWIRTQAFLELGRYFTYRLTIRSDHELITTGPYKYLRHPSYTGYIVGGVCFHMFMLYHGLWDALVYPLTGVPLPAPVALAIFALYYGVFIFPRIHYEEVMLREFFGEKKWVEYASKRYRLIPFIY